MMECRTDYISNQYSVFSFSERWFVIGGSRFRG
jgi:hypothetical protein